MANTQRKPRDAAGNRSIAPADRPARRAYLPHVLSRLMNLLNLQLLQHLRSKRLTIGQFRLLQFVDQFDGATISEISADCVIEQSVVSRIVDQLEQRLMVTRKKNRSNARYVQVFMMRGPLFGRGRLNSTILPLTGSIRPIRLPVNSQNQSSPSGPVMMSWGPLLL